MVEIDSTALEQLLHLAVIARAAVDGIFATIALVRRACHDEVGAGDYLELVGPRLNDVSIGLLPDVNKHTRSMISRKCTSTLHSVRSGCFAELWINSESLPCRILDARYPKTKSNASMVLDFPEPLGPTIAENDYDVC